jgi:hypothetical protein
VSEDEIMLKLCAIDMRLIRLEKCLIPVVKDVSKHLAEAKELANKGKKPRKQPKKKDPFTHVDVNTL